MASKPEEITTDTCYVSWDHSKPFLCPVCDSKLVHEYNDGGRKVVTLKGPIWVITNYYRCTNLDCGMFKAFPAANRLALTRKKFGLDVWAKVIQHRFKHKLNYDLISTMMEDNWEVYISQGAIKEICQHFEAVGSRCVDNETLARVREAGRIILSLDGAQPQKDRPAFWVFTDRITGRILLSRYLEKASAEILAEIFKEIEKIYNVKIIAVISDKQRSIVNAVQLFNPKIKHAYCQFHFLHHIREPIASKDSHLLTVLRSVVKGFSIVISRPINAYPSNDKDSPVAEIFAPLAEELLCAVGTRGDRFKIFPGLEAYSNLEYILNRLIQYDTRVMTVKVRNSFDTLITNLQDLLSENSILAREIATLAMDFSALRAILKHRNWKGQKVKKGVDAWQYMLQGRLRRRGFEDDPAVLKWERPAHDMKLEGVWQQWVRLVGSYEGGLYHAYDDPEIDHTNNAKEGLFSRVKHHFRSTYGKNDIQDEFEMHADAISRLLDFDYTPDSVKEVLLATDIALVNGYKDDLKAVYISTHRKWRIREDLTGNFELFEHNIERLSRAN